MGEGRRGTLEEAVCSRWGPEGRLEQGMGRRVGPQEEAARVRACTCARVLALTCDVLIPSSPQHSFLPPSVVL